MPLVTDLLKAELKKAGKAVVNHLCEHFAYSRTELFAIVKTKRAANVRRGARACRPRHGCEICKPAVASILASLWNEDILEPEHQTLQDTNDRFLANMQRGGSYSVVPRVPGGEITPEKLAVIARVAKKYGLYTKITGGQRIDLFGARVEQLPDIWEELVDAGFESGHAYGKALRTVKSCVGTTWCRYGVQDSVGFAIRVENRYKGIRAPHKIKMAVSGCIRECAEAQSKDVGLIATEQGYNLYVCGNGGSKPRHADLLAADLDEETALRYIDRFLMYYIMTADRLTRTSVWCEKLEGGLDHIRDVIIHDKLGIAAELEAMMQQLVDTYQCEWAAVVRDPEKRKLVPAVHEHATRRSRASRSSTSAARAGRPIGRASSCRWSSSACWTAARWANTSSDAEPRRCAGSPSATSPTSRSTAARRSSTASRRSPCSTSPAAASGTPRQNMCPHKKAFVLSRGILGDAGGRAEGRLPAAQEDVLARQRRVAAGRGVPHSHVPGAGRGRRRATGAAAAGGARRAAGDGDRLPAGDVVRDVAGERRRELANASASDASGD